MNNKIHKLSISGKALGYLLSMFGLLILAEPHFSTGLLTEAFIGDSWEVNAIGMLVMTVGAILITGLPTFNGLWDKIEYGIPLLLFFVGFSLLYINTWGTDKFLLNISSYILFSTVAVIIIAGIKVVYSDG